VPKALFKIRTLTTAHSILGAYDVTADGKRFMVGTLAGESKATAPAVILNWVAALKR